MTENTPGGKKQREGPRGGPPGEDGREVCLGEGGGRGGSERGQESTGRRIDGGFGVGRRGGGAVEEGVPYPLVLFLIAALIMATEK